VLAVFAQHLGDTHLPFVRARVDATLPPEIAPWLMTVLHHAHWGVDLFFVLSGFSLAQPILARAARAAEGAKAETERSGPRGAAADEEAPRTRLASLSPSPEGALAFSSWGRSFFRRRAARIYPAYLVALALVITTVPAVRHHPSFPASLAAHLALVQGYVTPGGLAIIGAAWSLTTEVTFYLAWPLLAPRILAAPVRAGQGSPREALTTASATRPSSADTPAPAEVAHVARAGELSVIDRPASSAGETRPRKNPWVTGIVLVLAVWVVRGVLHEVALRASAPSWLFEASQRRWAVSRVDQFILGGLAASLHARAVRSRFAAGLARIAPVLVVLAALALVPAFYLEGTFHPEPLGSWPYALVSLATAALVFASASAGPRASRWLFPGPLRAVGVVSYGVFLHHQLALGATAHASGPAGSWGSLATHAGLALALSLLLGWLSWVLVERPVIERAARRSRWDGRRGGDDPRSEQRPARRLTCGCGGGASRSRRPRGRAP
jgi:peptidoglycan/LPS O-acetylase OafA/YrhL